MPLAAASAANSRRKLTGAVLSVIEGRGFPTQPTITNGARRSVNWEVL